MWLNKLYDCFLGPAPTGCGTRPPASRQRGLRLRLEQLEDRTVPANFTAASVSDLIADMNSANQTAEPDTITLAPGTTFTLTEVNNAINGANGLPTLVANDNLTIIGNGDVIERSTATGTPAFRLFDVAAGATLTLNNVTLQGGLLLTLTMYGPPGGGAIYNQGTLALHGVTVQNNTAQGQPAVQGQSAAGGGIYSGGSLTLQDCAIQKNQAIGGHGGAFNFFGVRGGDGFGGGLYVVGGTVAISNTTLTGNTARGGDGGDGGHARFGHPSGPGGAGGAALGGGLCAAGGSVSLHNSTVSMNDARGGNGGNGGSGQPNGTKGQGIGGGIYIDSTLASVGLDAFTVDHVKRNHASTADDNIHGCTT